MKSTYTVSSHQRGGLSILSTYRIFDVLIQICTGYSTSYISNTYLNSIGSCRDSILWSFIVSARWMIDKNRDVRLCVEQEDAHDSIVLILVGVHMREIFLLSVWNSMMNVQSSLTIPSCNPVTESFGLWHSLWSQSFKVSQILRYMWSLAWPWSESPHPEKGQSLHPFARQW
jgi:hypothetical protein